MTYDQAKTYAIKNQSGIFIFIGALVLAVFAYWIYTRGKQSGKGVNESYPNAGNGIPAGWDAQTVAKRFNDAMSGWAYRKADLQIVATEAIGYTDDQLVALYNAWQNLYYPNWKRDIVVVFASESCQWGFLTIGNPFTCDIQSKLIAKFDQALAAARSTKKT